MKQARIGPCLSVELLKFVRDEQPSEAQVLMLLGASCVGCYYVLKKAGLFLDAAGIVTLNPTNMRANGGEFTYENRIYGLDTGIVSYVQRRTTL